MHFWDNHHQLGSCHCFTLWCVKSLCEPGGWFLQFYGWLTCNWPSLFNFFHDKKQKKTSRHDIDLYIMSILLYNNLPLLTPPHLQWISGMASSGGQFSSILLFWSASKNWHDKGWPFVGNAIFDGDYLKWSWKEGWPLVWVTLFERDYLNWSMKLFIYSLLSIVSSTIIILIDFWFSY